MIKPGQIYITPICHYNMIVTHIDYWQDGQETPIDDITCIFEDGDVQYFRRSEVDGMKLIAEYPTWQEAINSKEFNGGAR